MWSGDGHRVHGVRRGVPCGVQCVGHSVHGDMVQGAKKSVKARQRLRAWS